MNILVDIPWRKLKMIELTLKIEPSEISEELQNIKIQDYAQILKNLKPETIVMIENADRKSVV